MSTEVVQNKDTTEEKIDKGDLSVDDKEIDDHNKMEKANDNVLLPKLHRSNSNKGNTVIDVPGSQKLAVVTDYSVAEKAFDLDDVLVNEIGQFGKFQLRNLLLVTLPLLVSGFVSDYLFIAAASPHRCMIPECGELSKTTPFDPEWIGNAIPKGKSGLSSCQRFAPVEVGLNGSLALCPAELFNQTRPIPCTKTVYAKNNSMVYDFDLGCQDWLRGLIGTMGSLGMLCALPVAGVISDRFGRRSILVISAFNSGILGVLKAFSVNYPMSLVLQFLWTGLGVGAYNAAYIFAAEFVGPEYRVLMSATCSSIFAVGEVIMACVAWLVQPWRTLVLVLNVPCFLLIANYWLLPESVRWLLSKKRFEEAKQVLENVAKVNGKEISEKSMEALISSSVLADGKRNKSGPGLVKTIIASPVLLRRVCTTPVCWVATTFVYYGLSINSTSLSDTIYLNFILTSVVEIPGYYSSALFLDRFGRRRTLFATFALSSLCNFIFVFISYDKTTVRMVLFLLGKFSISVVFASLYLYTAELYPTEYRHSLLNFSSMIGRIGSITAPLTPVLDKYWHGLPTVMFGVMGLVGALLVLTQPETLGTRLPDTLAEAEALGRPESKLKPAKVL